MNLNRNVSSRDLGSLFVETQNCLNRYDYQGATELLERAHKLEPENDKILVDLGGACAKAFNFSAAQRWFDEAVRVSRKPADCLLAIGHSWMDVRHFEAAKNTFERLLQSNPVPLATYVRLAEIYVRMRRLDDATQIVTRGIQAYGHHEAILLAGGKVHRQRKEYELAEKIFRLIVSPRNNSEPGVRAAAWYELAALLDSKGDYDQAMDALLQAKSLMRLSAGGPLKILQKKREHLKQMAGTAKPEAVQRWRKFGQVEFQPARKLALLCGHARSGTTLLEYVLDAHPDVVSAEESTVYHNKAYFPLGQAVSSNSSFVSALDWLNARTMRQIRSEYFRGIESLLGEPIGDRLLLDKNPANTFDIPSIARIFPDNKFVVALRDPRDVCLSCFMQPVGLLPDTASWLTLEETIKHFGLIMGLWVAWKPCVGDMAIEVRYEDLVSNLEGTARRTLEFLGLSWDDRVMRFNEHASTKIVRSPTFAEVTKPLYNNAVGRWKNYAKYFEPHTEQLKPILRDLGYE